MFDQILIEGTVLYLLNHTIDFWFKIPYVPNFGLNLNHQVLQLQHNLTIKKISEKIWSRSDVRVDPF